MHVLNDMRAHNRWPPFAKRHYPAVVRSRWSPWREGGRILETELHTAHDDVPITLQPHIEYAHHGDV